jgi:hypothetical protein
VSPAAGWYADPGVPGRLRWWDGSRWTEHVTPDPNLGEREGSPGDATSEGASPGAVSRPAAGSGWYADPSGVAGQLRWWDGARWTAQVAADPDAGRAGGATSDPAPDPEPGTTDHPRTASGEEPPSTVAAGDAATDEPAVPTDEPAVPTDEPAVPTDELAAPTEETAASGWYPDPSGVPEQLRWWDGRTWTERVTPDPLASAAGHGVAVPTDDPASVPDAASVPGPAQEVDPDQESDAPDPDAPDAAPDASPGDVASAPAEGEATEDATAEEVGGAGETTADEGHGASERATAGATSSGRIRTRTIVLTVIAVVAVGVLATNLTRDDEAPSSPTAAERSDEGPPPQEGTAAPDPDALGTPSSEPLEVGDGIQGEVPAEGSFEVDLVVEQAGEVTIDVQAGGGWDPVVELTDLDGVTVAYNDDRGEAAAERVGGDYYDPLIVTELEPGTYRLIVRGFQSDAGAFELRTS